MKVIFLDIDGVLNTTQTFRDIHQEFVETGKRRIEIDLNRLSLLKEIVDKTGAVIVLSSSWRNLGKMSNGNYIPLNEKMTSFIRLLEAYGLSIYDITPRDPRGIRQNEIDKWLEDKEVEQFIVLDDDSYDLQKFLHKELIKTSFTADDEMVKDMNDCTGLCEHHVQEAIKKLTLKKEKI